MLITIAPVLFIIVGLLVWLLCLGRLSELGRLVMLAGWVALAIGLGSYTVRLGDGGSMVHVR